MRLLAIDPGVHETGYAIFDNSDLVKAGLATSGADFPDNIPEIVDRTWALCTVIVIELPVVYERMQRHARSADIVKLAFTAGAIVGHICIHAHKQNIKILTPTPREWKGQIPKHIHHERLLRDRPEAASMIVNIPKSLKHNVLDAIALGYWALSKEL